MRVSYKWLSSLVDIEGIDIEVLSKTITEAGLEVEEISYLARGTNLVIGYVEKKEPHPDSDHLNVCQVNLGKETKQIVCGAPNVAAGQKVVVAKEGAYLPAIDLTIKKSAIRGVESNGMICSLGELGVEEKYISEEEKKGIHVLDNDAPVGDENPLAYMGLDDVLLEVSLTPNRGDCQSLYNLAKDVAAIMNRKMKVDFAKTVANKGRITKISAFSNTEKCDYFSVRKINNIKIKESPKWLQSALIGSGLRPINNIVDISNYLMLLFGQPIHMYDYDKLKGNNFVIRDDIHMEVKTLDDNSIEILPNDLVVTIAGEPGCLAGVMGLNNTMIDENTKNIVIEVASFNGVSIRKTANRLQLFSDASARYIKGLDMTQFSKVMEYATTMVRELADGDDIEEVAIYDRVKYKDKVINITTDKINSVLGTSFSKEEVRDCFNRLGFSYKEESNNFEVKVPSYRNDISISEDLIEEIIRIEGYDHLTSTLPNDMDAIGELTLIQARRKQIREFMMSNGLNEVLTYTLTDEKHSPYFDVFSSKDQAIKLMSALGKDKEFLRKSILPTLLNTVEYNQARQVKNVNIFEISNVYTENGSYERLAVALSNKLDKTDWLNKKNSDYFTAKGLFESLLRQLGIAASRVGYKPLSDSKFYHPYRSALVSIDKKVVAVIGEVHPLMYKEYKVDKTVLMEVDLAGLLNVKTSDTKYKKLPTYPSMSRDVALLLKEEITSEEVIRLIKKTGRELVVDVTPFDEYKGEHVDKGYRSLALNIVYQDMNKTLTDNEVTAVHKNIVESLVLNLSAQIR